MLDISSKRKEPDKAIAYLDGPDARVFARLLNSLGSEEKVHNGMILFGLMQKLQAQGRGGKKAETSQLKKLRSYFSEVVGISYEDFVELALEA